MNGEMLFMILFGLIISGYVVLYIKGQKYLEGFTALSYFPERQRADGKEVQYWNSNEDTTVVKGDTMSWSDPEITQRDRDRKSVMNGWTRNSDDGTGPTVGELYPTALPVQNTFQDESNKPGRVVMETTSLDPVAKGQIKKLDDYEYNMVYQNESDRELSLALKNKLMSQRPMDWSGMPPSSSQFQAGLRESFANGSSTVPEDAQPYQDMTGDGLNPPDTEAVEMEERKILQTYKPPSANELGSYNPDEDPEKMIHRLYNAKGLIPQIAHQEGTPVYEIIGVRKVGEKVLYEDEHAPASIAPVRKAGEANIVVPPAAYDMAAAVDPFYDTSSGMSKSRMGKWDYQKWTPGLDRMFAPTNDTETWS